MSIVLRTSVMKLKMSVMLDNIEVLIKEIKNTEQCVEDAAKDISDELRTPITSDHKGEEATAEADSISTLKSLRERSVW